MMTLSQLCRDLPVAIRAEGDPRVQGITLDSRAVRPGFIFAAVVDAYRNGENFISDAVKREAAAVLAAENFDGGGAPLILAKDVRKILGIMAHRLAGDPTKDICLIGVTGTNAKTTFTYIMESILLADGRRVGVVGTITHRYDGKVFPAPNTTPEAPDLARFFDKMRGQGVNTAVMEVSSHGLALDRVAGCRFDAAVFTNLSRDHLDFHRDDEDYLAAKMKLFTEHLKPGKETPAIVNIDDPAGKRIVAARGGKAATYGRDSGAMYRIESFTADSTGLEMNLSTPRGAMKITSPLLGHYQAYNVTAAVAAAMEMGIGKETIIDAVAAMRGVPGRMENIPDDEIDVIVDYAHTPDAVRTVVEAGRKMTRGRLITIFGCGGDRDKGKRPLMAQAAQSASDIILVTSDNPRTEDPARIIDDILTGVDLDQCDRLDDKTLGAYEGRRGVWIEINRPKAVACAIHNAKAKDMILIVGKGHEDYQIIGKEKFHLDDREEAAKALKARRRNAAEPKVS